MKFPVILFALFFLNQPVFAQQEHFLYLENELGKAFYARMGERSYSSSATGYVIIPHLSTGWVDLTIGFAKNEWKPQTFKLLLEEDAGYVLQLSPQGDWQLSSIRDVAVMENPVSSPVKSIAAKPNNPDPLPVAKPAEPLPAKVDSQVQPDSTMVSVMPSQSVSTDSVSIPNPSSEKKESEALKPVDIKNIVPDKRDSLPAMEIGKVDPVRDSMVRVLTRVQNSDGYRALYYVPASGDTVEVTLLNGMEGNMLQDALAYMDKQNEKKLLGDPSDKKDESAGKKTEKEAGVQNQPEAKPAKSIPAISPMITAKTSCKVLATMGDFMQLRKNMAAQRTEESMTTVAKKFLQTKCVSASQVANLVVLYLTDEGRYGFLDACYPHVSDPAVFPALEKHLTDPYYINRFRAMLR